MNSFSSYQPTIGRKKKKISCRKQILPQGEWLITRHFHDLGVLEGTTIMVMDFKLKDIHQSEYSE